MSILYTFEGGNYEKIILKELGTFSTFLRVGYSHKLFEIILHRDFSILGHLLILIIPC